MKHSIMKPLFFSISLLIVQVLFAQDVIIMKNGDELSAKVLEVGSSEIKYKKFENPDGPTYSVEKSNVFMIRYENGSKDVFKETQSTTTPTSTPTTQTNKRSDSSPDELAKGSLNVNPLGLLQFGPIIQYEARIGSRAVVVPYFRYAFAGVATHAIWEVFSEDSELAPSSAAIGLGVKGFTSTENSLYYGTFLDFSWTTARYNISGSDASEQVGNHLALISNIGHRWRSSRGTYINLGAYAGAAFTLKNEERYMNSGELIEVYDDVTIFAMVELSFGWEFK